MAGIFKILFNLKIKSHKQPLEDYLTEVFAYCLDQDIGFLNGFLIHFKVIEKGSLSSNVSTQVYLKALPDHNCDSRPDMAIYLDDAVVFIENKIGTGEGDSQLKRYAEHLYAVKDKKRHLIYITRDFDPKVKADILKKCENEVNFIPLRWFKVFNFLKAYKSNPIANELLLFMKSIRLSMNNQFTPTDLITLSNFSKVRRMLDDSMYGEVSGKFSQINKGISKSSASLTQLRDHDRYTYWKHYREKMSVSLGYWMNFRNEKNYPDVGLTIEVDPNSGKREEIIRAFSKIWKEDKFSLWYGYNLGTPKAWAGVATKKSLQSFLSGEDHIKAIQRYFLERLDELEVILADYGLPRVL